MIRGWEEKFAHWLEHADMPAAVREVAREFTPDIRFDVDGQIHYIIGYAEDNAGQPMICISPKSPGHVGMAEAQRHQTFVSAENARASRRKVAS